MNVAVEGGERHILKEKRGGTSGETPFRLPATKGAWGGILVLVVEKKLKEKRLQPQRDERRGFVIWSYLHHHKKKSEERKLQGKHARVLR